jgi:bacterioferritin-associated ferredoxin
MQLPKTLPREREELTRLGVPPTLDFHISDWTYVRDWELRVAIQRLLANSPSEHSKYGGVKSASGPCGQQRAQVMMELPNDRDRCGLAVFLGPEVLAFAVLQTSKHSEGVPSYLGECAYEPLRLASFTRTGSSRRGT